VSQLRRHHLWTADLAKQRRLIDDKRQAEGRISVCQYRLAGYSSLDPPLNDAWRSRVEILHGINHMPAILGCRQKSGYNLNLPLCNRFGFCFESDELQKVWRHGIGIFLRPASLVGVRGKAQQLGPMRFSDLIVVKEFLDLIRREATLFSVRSRFAVL
jgi:hypothetical protein